MRPGIFAGVFEEVVCDLSQLQPGSDLLGGFAIQDGALASATGLTGLTLARRDSLLRRLSTASPAFLESLRNASIVAPSEPVELPLPEESDDLLGGLARGLRADKLQEALSLSTELVLRAYYGKDSRYSSKRPASPRGGSQPKRPKNGPS